jgi:dipeptidase
MRQVWDYDTGDYRGEIPQPSYTFNVMGNCNERGLCIAETTYGGRSELSTKNGTIMDYGSLIYSTLQRTETARQAIQVVNELTSAYGYASSAEGFSISDGEEVWLLELVGKGTYGTGLVWVALRVPEGHVTAHANQGRITTFLPCDDADTCMMASDVVTFAIERGYWSGASDDPSFSFSDTYDPVTSSGARFCEARVWAIFSLIADPADFDPAEFLDYAQGYNLTNRMPLFVKPKAKLSRDDLHSLLSNHFEGTWFDPTLDVGAGAEHSPYRWNGLTWTDPSDQNLTFVNERVIGTQYQAWHFVAEIKKSMPAPMRALSWWGSDEHAWAPKVPLYGGATTLDITYDDKNCSARLACRKDMFDLPGSMLEFSWESAYWVNSAVAKQVYGGVEATKAMVNDAKSEFEAWAMPLQEKAEAEAQACFESTDTSGCTDILDDLAVTTTKEATARWTALWQSLMVTYMDGMVAKPDDSNLLCGCSKTHLDFSDAWRTKVIDDTGPTRYLLPTCPEGQYVDPDGHCQPLTSSKIANAWRGASRSRGDGHLIPKVSVPGVAG